MSDADNELDRLDPAPSVLKLTTGMQVEVVRLQTRQLFRLLKVLTHGAGPEMLQSALDFSQSGDEFAGRLLALLALSIPEAEQQAIEFINSMVKPHGIIERPAATLSKQQRQDNQTAWDQLAQDLYNPDLTDTIDIIEEIVKREAGEIQALGKKLQRLAALMPKTGQDKKAEPAPTPQQMAETDEPDSVTAGSPAPSPPGSTSSPASTAGPTSTSTRSRSAGSGKSSMPSAGGAAPPSADG